MKLIDKIFLLGFLLGLQLSGFSQILSAFSEEDQLLIPSVKFTCTTLDEKEQELFHCDSTGHADVGTFVPSATRIVVDVEALGFIAIRDTIKRTVSKTYQLSSSEIEGLVITAQFQPGKASESVYKVRVIRAEKIKRMGAQNLGDVLSNELNVRISKDNILGSGMSLQGLSGQNVKILVDGVAVIGRLDGNIDLSQINMNNVERIEVVEGPMSVNYGSDALAGTVNIITKKNQANQLNFSSDSYYESIGHFNQSVRFGFQKSKNNWAISLGRNFFDGWRTGESPFSYVRKAIADSARFMDWKSKAQVFGQFFWGHDFEKLKLSYSGDVFNEDVIDRGLPRLPYFETAFDNRYRTVRINHALRLIGQLGAKHHLKAQAASNFFRRQKNTWFNDLTRLDKTLSMNDGDQDTSKFRSLSSRASISSKNKRGKLNYEIGYDAKLERATGLRIEEGRKDLLDGAAFVSLELKATKRLVFRPGLRYGYNSIFKAPFIPSINFKYAQKSITLRGSYARGFRAPSLKELYFLFQDTNHDIVGNEFLNAELSDNLNFNFAFVPSSKGKLHFELGTYLNKVQNLITLAQVSGNSYSYVNLGNYQAHGLQFKTEFRSGLFATSIGAGVTGRSTQNSNHVELPHFFYALDISGNLKYTFMKMGLTASLFYRYVGKTPFWALNDQSEVETRFVRSYQLIDVSFGRDFWSHRLNLGIGAKNILNVTSINVGSSSGAHQGQGNIQIGTGRSYFVKLGLNFKSKR